MDRFIINYNGNKYQETKKYLKDFIEKSNYECIIEPFGGIFGFSRYYYLLKNENKNLKFMINDIDSELISFYKELKKDFEGTLIKLRKKFDDITKDMTKDIELTKYLRDKDDCKFIELISKSIRGTYSISKFNTKFNNFMKKKEEYKNMFERTKFYNMDVLEFLKLIPVKKNNLIYFDPPYFNSDNSYYNTYMDNYSDGTTCYLTILDFFIKTSHHCIFVMNKIDIINHIFKEYYHQEYEGTYQNTTKKKKHHIIYTKNI